MQAITFSAGWLISPEIVRAGEADLAEEIVHEKDPTGVRSGDRSSLEEAVPLWRGPLLVERDEPWAVMEQRIREQQLHSALEALAVHAHDRGAPQDAVPWLARLIQLDPMRATLRP